MPSRIGGTNGGEQLAGCVLLAFRSRVALHTNMISFLTRVCPNDGMPETLRAPDPRVRLHHPGDLTGAQHGIRDPRTGACHLSESQARSWGTRFFTPAVKKAAQHPELSTIIGATPYALRRGGISLRLRAEDPQTVAAECGTSLKMLSDHYAYAIEDLRRNGPRSAEVEWRAARAAQADKKPVEQSPRADTTPENDTPKRQRKNFFAWFSARKRGSRVS
jgi:hypothetical protein